MITTLDFSAYGATIVGVKPLPHQVRLADKLDDADGVVAAHGLGSGKTFAAINAANKLGLPLMAVVPASLRENIKKEVAAAGFTGPVTVLSYDEALRKMDDQAFRLAASKSLLVFDEAHRMGRHESLRSQLTALPAAKKLLLTATPIRNSPHEIAPLLRATGAAGIPVSEAEFNARYIKTEEEPVGLWGRLTGVKPGIVKSPTNMRDFKRKAGGRLDFYDAIDRSEYPSTSESVINVPMSDSQQGVYDMLMKKNSALAYKVRNNLHASPDELRKLTSFMIGVRQASNHPGVIAPSLDDTHAPKLQRAADEIEKRVKADPNFRGVVYSTYLNAGVTPMQRILESRGIKSAPFTGSLSDQDRKSVIADYNSGKLPVLLISGAGAEGLDLKGTKLLQVLEPHWNDELISQVKGRAVRYKSHEHLPEAERHVEVQRFHAIPQRSFFRRMFGMDDELGADEYIYARAKEKSTLNKAFLDAAKSAELHAELNAKRKTILFDLDGTLVAEDAWSKDDQELLPGRLDVLTQLFEAGYALAGVTNRHAGDDCTVEQAERRIEAVEKALGGLLETVIWHPVRGPWSKPAPDMILYAMKVLDSDPTNTAYVGDTDSDAAAAAAAGIEFVHVNEFFPSSAADSAAGTESVHSNEPITDQSKAAMWTSIANRDKHVKKHWIEFGSREAYLATENFVSNVPLARTAFRKQCNPEGCTTAYYIPSLNAVHVKRDSDGKTVTLYKKL